MDKDEQIKELAREVEALKARLIAAEHVALSPERLEREQQLERQLDEAQQRIGVVQEERDAERRRYEDSLERIAELANENDTLRAPVLTMHGASEHPPYYWVRHGSTCQCLTDATEYEKAVGYVSMVPLKAYRQAEARVKELEAKYGLSKD